MKCSVLLLQNYTERRIKKNKLLQNLTRLQGSNLWLKSCNQHKVDLEMEKREYLFTMVYVVHWTIKNIRRRVCDGEALVIKSPVAFVAT